MRGDVLAASLASVMWWDDGREWWTIGHLAQTSRQRKVDVALALANLELRGWVERGRGRYRLTMTAIASLDRTAPGRAALEAEHGTLPPHLAARLDRVVRPTA